MLLPPPKPCCGSAKKLPKEVQTSACEVHLEMLVSEVKNETPAGLKKRLADEAKALRVASYESDHNVQDLVNKFSGVVLKDSIVKIRDR